MINKNIYIYIYIYNNCSLIDFFQCAEITSDIVKLKDNAGDIDWASFIFEMKDFMVQEYGQQPLDAYKEDWKRRFKEVATALKCTTGRSAHDNWNLVATAIQEEATTIVDTAATVSLQAETHTTSKGTTSSPS